jgi:hypothetical protein
MRASDVSHYTIPDVLVWMAPSRWHSVYGRTGLHKAKSEGRNRIQKDINSDTGNRTQGCSVRASDVSHYTISDVFLTYRQLVFAII